MQVTVGLSVFILATILLSFCAFTPVQAAVNWNTHTVDENGAYIDGHCPIVIDSNNTVHIAYSAIYNDTYWVMYATWNGSGFNIETVTKGNGAYSLVLDANGNPHILYGIWYGIPYTGGYPVGRMHALSIAEWNGKAWEIKSTSIGNALRGTLVLDSHGNPHIAYIVDGKVQYARYTGTLWNIQTVDTIPEPSGFSLALDSNNTPYILYSPTSYIGEYQGIEIRAINIKLAIYQNSNWALQVITLPSPTGRFGNIVLDSKGYPHFICTQHHFVSAENATTLSKLLYASWNGTNWNTEVISKEDISVDEVGQLVLDSKDNPYFCFKDYGGVLYYVQNSQGTWDIQNSYMGALGPFYLALNSTGNPHVSYRVLGGRFFAPVIYGVQTEIQNDVPPIDSENYLLAVVAIIALVTSIIAIAIFYTRDNEKPLT
jgi:hypothetical protein